MDVYHQSANPQLTCIRHMHGLYAHMFSMFSEVRLDIWTNVEQRHITAALTLAVAPTLNVTPTTTITLAITIALICNQAHGMRAMHSFLAFGSIRAQRLVLVRVVGHPAQLQERLEMRTE